MPDALTGSDWSWRDQCRARIADDLAKTTGRSYAYRVEHLDRARPAEASASGWRGRVWLEEMRRALLYLPKGVARA